MAVGLVPRELPDQIAMITNDVICITISISIDIGCNKSSSLVKFSVQLYDIIVLFIIGLQTLFAQQF